MTGQRVRGSTERVATRNNESDPSRHSHGQIREIEAQAVGSLGISNVCLKRSRYAQSECLNSLEHWAMEDVWTRISSDCSIDKANCDPTFLPDFTTGENHATTSRRRSGNGSVRSAGKPGAFRASIPCDRSRRNTISPKPSHLATRNLLFYNPSTTSSLARPAILFIRTVSVSARELWHAGSQGLRHHRTREATAFKRAIDSNLLNNSWTKVHAGETTLKLISEILVLLQPQTMSSQDRTRRNPISSVAVSASVPLSEPPSHLAIHELLPNFWKEHGLTWRTLFPPSDHQG